MYRLTTVFGGHELVSQAETIEDFASTVFANLYRSPDGRQLLVVKEGLPGLVRVREYNSCLSADSELLHEMDGMDFRAFAESPSGKSLDVMMLFRWGENRWKNRRGWWSRRLDGWNGEGPVPGVSKCRGGGGTFRHPRTMNERRVSFVADEFEPPPRKARSAGYLSTAWDDILIRRERNWKSQHKGVKSWDRNR